jgi:hypothetical protein
MTDRRIILSDRDLEAALTPQPRPDLTQSIADDVAALVRATPQLPASRLPWGGTSRIPPLYESRARRMARLAVMVALLLALAAGLALAAATLLRDPLPRNGLLAVGSDRAGLFLVDPATTTVEALLEPWHSNASRVSDAVGRFAWAPDGERLAYIETRAESWTIHVLDGRSGQPVERIDAEGSEDHPDGAMQWTADGTRLIVEGDLDGLPGIMSVEVATGRVDRIGPPDSQAWSPAISPVGDRVAFTSTVSRFSTTVRLTVAGVDGSGHRELISEADDGWVVHGTPDWSPDESSLLVGVRRADGSHALLHVAEATGEMTVLWDGIRDPVEGRWSPDGSHVLAIVTTADGFSGDLHVMGADGSERRAIRVDACPNADWAPDGTVIAFEHGGCDPLRFGGVLDVRTIAPDGSDEQVLWSIEWPNDQMTHPISISWQAIPRDE